MRVLGIGKCEINKQKRCFDKMSTPKPGWTLLLKDGYYMPSQPSTRSEFLATHSFATSAGSRPRPAIS